jgi:hypothetical protein
MTMASVLPAQECPETVYDYPAREHDFVHSIVTQGKTRRPFQQWLPLWLLLYRNWSEVAILTL